MEAHTDPEVLSILPAQGEWTEREYLWLTERTNRLVELNHGTLEFCPMPSYRHQILAGRLFSILQLWFASAGGVCCFAPLRMRLSTGVFREPDLLALRSAGDPRIAPSHWNGADLCVEVLSPDDPNRDLVIKRAEYEASAIPEYWIVDPRDNSVLQLVLRDGAYVEHARLNAGHTLRSVEFDGLTVSLAALFA